MRGSESGNKAWTLNERCVEWRRDSVACYRVITLSKYEGRHIHKLMHAYPLTSVFIVHNTNYIAALLPTRV